MENIQFMAWERSFENRVLKIRDRELFYQWRNYVIEASSEFVVGYLLLTSTLDSLQCDLATLSNPHYCDRLLALCSCSRQTAYTCHCLHFCMRFTEYLCVFNHS